MKTVTQMSAMNSVLIHQLLGIRIDVNQVKTRVRHVSFGPLQNKQR